jgi:hypothetical protein
LLEAISAFACKVTTVVTTKTDILVWGTSKRPGNHNLPYVKATQLRQCGYAVEIQELAEFLQAYPEVNAAYRELCTVVSRAQSLSRTSSLASSRA